MSYWGFLFIDLIKELHLGLDFDPVSQTQIAQTADPALFLVGSRSWRLHSLWDAWQEVEALTHRRPALPGSTMPGLQAPHLEGQWDMCRHHCTCYDCVCLSCLLSFSPLEPLQNLLGPCRLSFKCICHEFRFSIAGTSLQSL